MSSDYTKGKDGRKYKHKEDGTFADIGPSESGARENPDPAEAVAQLADDTTHRAANPSSLAIHENPNTDDMDTPSLKEGKDSMLAILGGAGLGVAGDALASNAADFTANKVDPENGKTADAVRVLMPLGVGTSVYLASDNSYVRSVALGMGLTTVRNGVQVVWDYATKMMNEESDGSSGSGDDTQDSSTNGVAAANRQMSETAVGVDGLEGGFSTEEDPAGMAGGFSTEEQMARGI